MTALIQGYVSPLVSEQHRVPALTGLNSTSLVPGIHRELLSEAVELSPGWRFPAYEKWFQTMNYLQNIDEDGTVRALRWGQKLWLSPMQKFLPATFIEWRYYSIISKEFHGIVGISLFNPVNGFSALTEGGLLVIVAGVLDAPQSYETFVEGNERQEIEEVCWMKLFPTGSVLFSGKQLERVNAKDQDIELFIDQERNNSACIRLSGEGAPQIDIKHTGSPGTSLHPYVAEDLKRVPGAHWIVHNPSPTATVSGKMDFSYEMLKTLPLKGTSTDPSYVSRAFLDRTEKAGNWTAHLQRANGYYEHSYGMNPMPCMGWDFAFAPRHQDGTGLVLQTYMRSNHLRYVEVIWKEGRELKHFRFGAPALQLEWSQHYFHKDIRAKLPRVRSINSQQDGYTLEVEIRIATVIPFLRRKTFIVRSFFIAEDISFTSWTLRNPQGLVVAQGKDVPSGGETAYPRLSSK